MTVRYAIVPTDLGLMLLGATDRGLCSLKFGDDPLELTNQLTAEFPRATLQVVPPDQPQIVLWHTALSEYRQGLRTKFEELPLDISGTVFQHQVWQYLQQIPIGEVQSYTKVAQGIGRPKAVRAVASACAANQVAVVIPCHRVIRSNGHLGGYRWGLERKQQLIDQEQIATSQR